VVSATNKNLGDQIEEKKFRLDLFYRISVISIQIPSLNDRKEDILPIAEYFLAEFGKKLNRQFTGFSAAAKDYLTQHQWNGNIREMKNMIERGAIIGTGPLLTPEDLGVPDHAPGIRQNNESLLECRQFPPLPEEGLNLESLEQHFIKEALRLAGGNDTKAARLLGLNYYAFRYRRRKNEQNENNAP
jgi:DNA-binding NtrC family response regulator